MKNIIRLTYALTCALLMQGCCASKPPVTIVSGSSTEADSTNTTIHERIVTIHDTVTLYIPVESHSSVGEDSSHLETDFATSDAWIDSVGKLHHNIDSKPQEVPVPVDVHVPVADTSKYESHTKIDSIPYPVPYEVPVEKELTWWQETQMRGFWVLLVGLVVFVAWKTRKVWLKLLK